jgi:hypothetical protein
VFKDGLNFGRSKCEPFMICVDILRYVLDKRSLFAKCDNMQGLYNLKIPTTRTDAKRLYRLLSFFRRFLKPFSSKSKFITDWLGVGDDIVWSDSASGSVYLVVDKISY